LRFFFYARRKEHNAYRYQYKQDRKEKKFKKM